MPEVSVIVPCWNVAEWVEDSLKSVLAALPTQAEVIAIDDGSTDATGALLARIAAGDGRVRIITRENRGVSAARNRGLDRATGKYVFFVDPDDTVAPDFFTAMLDAIKTADADFCVCGFSGFPLRAEYRFDTAEEILGGYVKRILGYGFGDIRAWYRGTPLFESREMASVWRGAYRREIIERHSIRFDESVALFEDSLFNVEYLLHANRMTCVNRCLYNVRDRASGAMRRLGGDAAFVCRNKLKLLRKRNALDAASGGKLAEMYAGTCVLGALEMLSLTVRGRLPRRDGISLLRTYLADDRVRSALRCFPLSWRKPTVAMAVLALRLLQVTAKVPV